MSNRRKRTKRAHKTNRQRREAGNRTLASNADMSGLEAAQWLPEIGGMLGLAIGGYMGSLLGRWSFLLVGALGGLIGGFIIGEICRHKTMNSINRRR